MQTRTLDLSTPDGPMPLYEAMPEERARAGVIVIQEAFGVNSHIEDVTRRFAAEGYHAVAPHLFHRTGGGTVGYGDMQSVQAHFSGLSDSDIVADVDLALAHLEQAALSRPRVGIVGFSMGGRISFLVAARRPLGAAVAFYGGGIVTSRMPNLPPLVSEAATLKTPLLALFGLQDPGIPPEDVDRLEVELGAAEVDTEVVRYPEAGHGFFCDERESFNPQAADDGWRRTLDWFERHLPA